MSEKTKAEVATEAWQRLPDEAREHVYSFLEDIAKSNDVLMLPHNARACRDAIDVLKKGAEK